MAKPINLHNVPFSFEYAHNRQPKFPHTAEYEGDMGLTQYDNKDDNKATEILTRYYDNVARISRGFLGDDLAAVEFEIDKSGLSVAASTELKGALQRIGDNAQSLAQTPQPVSKDEWGIFMGHVSELLSDVTLATDHLRAMNATPNITLLLEDLDSLAVIGDGKASAQEEIRRLTGEPTVVTSR